MTGLRLGCSVSDALCPHLQGSLPAALGNLSELVVLDIQVNRRTSPCLVSLLQQQSSCLSRCWLKALSSSIMLLQVHIHV